MIPSPEIWSASPRCVVGLMSGTSIDGIDAALVIIGGGIPYDSMRVQGFLTRPFTEHERGRISGLLRPDVPLQELLTANVWLGELFAEVALQVIRQSGLTPAQVDAVASHGQTIWHIPPKGKNPGATMQIGEPCVIAERTGVLTVADFRPRDMAAGGQGAPLVPFADHLMFPHDEASIAVQNIGGIGNVTWLPSGGDISSIVAFDTGPGNMVIDALVGMYGLGEFDCNGEIAASGVTDDGMLQELLSHSFFHQPPPKSTGRELFGDAYADEFLLLAKGRGLSPESAIATATALTAESIARAYREFLPGQIDQVVLGGGGSKNMTLRRMLAERLPGITIRTHEDFGISSDAKEAVAFALLGYATLCGAANNVPSATGAAHSVVMGKIVPGG